MVDVFGKEKRSEIMSSIKGKGTQLEERGFAMLHEAGFRFRKHPKGVRGKPDAANKSKRLAIFFDSEFWHGYDWKRRRHDIKSNRKFWHKKIESNIVRDKEVNRMLRKDDWTVIRVWERDLNNAKIGRTTVKLAKIWQSLCSSK